MNEIDRPSTDAKKFAEKAQEYAANAEQLSKTWQTNTEMLAFANMALAYAQLSHVAALNGGNLG